MNVLCCDQWKSSSDIDRVLRTEVVDFKEKDFQDYFSNVIAGYNVFRYLLPAKSADDAEYTLDQAVFDSSRLDTRHETLSIRFHSRKSFSDFVLQYANETIPTYTKLMACFQRENPKALDILREELKTDYHMPTIQPQLDEPDLNFISVDNRTFDDLNDMEREYCLTLLIKDLGLSQEDVMAHRAMPI
jgi:hypothetical protein